MISHFHFLVGTLEGTLHSTDFAYGLEKQKCRKKQQISLETTCSHDFREVQHQIVDVAVFEKIEFLSFYAMKSPF